MRIANHFRRIYAIIDHHSSSSIIIINKHYVLSHWYQKYCRPPSKSARQEHQMSKMGYGIRIIVRLDIGMSEKCGSNSANCCSRQHPQALLARHIHLIALRKFNFLRKETVLCLTMQVVKLPTCRIGFD